MDGIPLVFMLFVDISPNITNNDFKLDISSNDTESLTQQGSNPNLSEIVYTH
jgi:hypothetical protein